ncbi:MAG: hypothetical protein JF614_03115 [Acidobacteria bacterium]|nr:hypothetical protein [Acidobacteriota bacterium]
MVIGSVLLQPQRLERAGQVPPGDAVLNDVISLAVRVVSDGVQGGRLGATLGGSVEGTVARLAARAGAGVSNAVTRFGALFGPLMAQVQALTAQPPGDVEALIGDLESGLTKVAGVLKNLTPEQIRQTMNTVFDILESDLGITPAFIRDLVLGLFDDMILALSSAPPNETSDERANRRAVAALLGRIKRFIQANFTFPTLNADVAAQAFVALRQRPDVDEVLTRALCSGKGAVAWLRAGSTLADLLPYSASPAFGPGSVGAAAAPAAREEVSFYASKLLEYDNWNGDLGTLPLPADQILDQGVVFPPLRDAFLHASVVLSHWAFLFTVEEDKEWRVVDRKQYLLTKTVHSLAVSRLFVISLSDFLSANQGDLSDLKKIFRENGVPVLSASSFTVTHADGSDTWDIDADGLSFSAKKFEGKVTIRPRTEAGVLFDLSPELQPAANEKAPSAALREAFANQGIPLSPRCTLAMREPESEWLLDDGEFEYTVKKDKGKFEVSTGGFFGWLFSTIQKPKGDVVWVNRERTQVLLGQRIMHVGSGVSWNDAPIFKRLNGNRRYSLKTGAATSEDWAYHASWIQDAVNVVLYAIKIGQSVDKEEVEFSVTSNSLNIGRLISEIVAKLAQHRPIGQVVGSDFVYDLMLDIVIGLVKIIEALAKQAQVPSPPASTTAGKGSLTVDSILSALVGVEIVDTHWSETLYEFVLSVLTLDNHEEPADASQQRPENYKESDGFVDLFWKGGLLVYTAAIPDSEYALPFETTSLTAGYWLGGATGVGLVTGFLGLLVGQGAVAKMNVFADAGQFLKTLAKSTGKSLLYFWPYLKLVKGKTT